MIKLKDAILYDRTRKAKALTWGVHIPFFSALAALKVNEIRNRMSGVDEEGVIDKYVLNQHLIIRQKIYIALNLSLRYAKGEQLKHSKDLFEEFFFIKYDAKKHKSFLAGRIKDLDDKILDLLTAEPETEGRTLSQSVADVELILNNGTIDRNISLIEFEDYFNNALLVLKERKKNG